MSRFNPRTTLKKCNGFTFRGLGSSQVVHARPLAFFSRTALKALIPKGSHIMLEYGYRGEVFKYVYGHGKLWTAQGHLESEPSVTVKTWPFPTKREVDEEFREKARKIIDDKLGPLVA